MKQLIIILKRLVFVLLVVFCSFSAQAQSEVVQPKEEKTWVDQFLKVLNSNDRSAMLRFVKNNQREAEYYLGIYNEFGPLSFSLKSKDKYSWFYGDITKAWVGLNVKAKDSASFEIRGIRRGIRPEEAKLPSSIPISRWSDYMDNYFKSVTEHDYFSGTVLIAEDNKIIFEGAYGLASREENQPNTLNTKFVLASLSKSFTGVAIAKLVQSGKMKYTDPIEKFIPEFPDHIGNKVTVHHLLSHTSGIELDNIQNFMEESGKARSMEEILKIQLKYLDQLPNYQNFEPLARYDYSNEGIDLLAIIINKVSGLNWKAYIKKEIFEPIGMVNSGFVDAHSPAIPNLASGYSNRAEDRRTRLLGARRLVKLNDPALIFLTNTSHPSGSIYSTVKDMAKFSNALQNHQILDKIHFDEIVKPQSEMKRLGPIQRGFGYGFDIHKRGQLLYCGHSGGAAGMNTAMYIFPDYKLTVVVLSNYDGGAGQKAFGHILDLIEAHALDNK